MPSVSVEPLPVRFTVAPESTVWSGPASAVGATLGAATSVLANETAGSSNVITPGSGPATVPGLQPKLTGSAPEMTELITIAPTPPPPPLIG